MINKQAKKEIAHAIIGLMFIAQVGSIWTGYQKSNTVVVYASEKAPTVDASLVPTTTPDPKRVGGFLVGLDELPDNAEEIVELIEKYFGEDTYTAVRIAHCESRLRQDRVHVNKDLSEDVGLFQINQKWHSHRGNAYDLEENIRIAKEIYDEQGFNPWVCYKLYNGGW